LCLPEMPLVFLITSTILKLITSPQPESVSVASSDPAALA